MDRRVAAVISLAYETPPADIESLATSVHLSASRLRHLFRRETGIPLHRYLRRQRLL